MYDLIVRGAELIDGTGAAPRRIDVAVAGDRVVALGLFDDLEGSMIIEAAGLVVAPGFINALSHSYFSILQDPRSMSELLQGVTTQVFGEGESMGPLTDPMRRTMRGHLERLGIDEDWSRLSEYLAAVERRGSSQNVCSYIGAATIRECVLSHEDRPPTATELDHMTGLVDEEMADGALGIGSSLIYPPGFFAGTDELVALCDVAARHGGAYISHLRSEGNGFLEALDELIDIAERSELPAEVYHLKASGADNWWKMQPAIDRIEAARGRGLEITADVYTYTAGGTSLGACIPPRYHEGGYGALLGRLRDLDVRAEISRAILESSAGWENLFQASGGGDGIHVLHTSTHDRSATGRTIAELAEERHLDPVEVLLRLVEENPPDGYGGVSCAFFMMSEDNLTHQLTLPWVSIASDATSMAAEEPWSTEPAHPRGYGCFARFLGHYVRDLGVATLPDAIRRMTSLPADNLGLIGRGRIREGDFADLVVLDPAKVADHATYDRPHAYATGIRDVVVNGITTVRGGEITGSFGGRSLRRGRCA